MTLELAKLLLYNFLPNFCLFCLIKGRHQPEFLLAICYFLHFHYILLYMMVKLRNNLEKLNFIFQVFLVASLLLSTKISQTSSLCQEDFTNMLKITRNCTHLAFELGCFSFCVI